MNKKYKRIAFIITILVSILSLKAHADSLSLKEVEDIALNTAPEISQLEHRAQSLREKSVAVGQLPDPTLQAGLLNVPTDSFSLTQENMTQIKVGIAQQFPKGASLSARSRQTQLLAEAEVFKRQEKAADILKIVRTDWLELFYWQQAVSIIEDKRVIFEHLVKVTESLLASGKQNQHDVLRAQLELSNIENRQIQMAEQVDVVRAQLARWIGAELASKISAQHLPQWPSLLSKKALQERIDIHPQLQMNAATIAASQQHVKLAEEQYKPGWGVGLHYGFRQGQSPMLNRQRADFISLQINVDLPLFTKHRQDKVLAERVATLNAHQALQLSEHRKLLSEMGQHYAKWYNQNKQIDLYRDKLVPESKQYAKSALTAYQNDQTDFTTVVRAHLTELNTELDYLKVRVSQYKTRAALLYLEEEVA